MVTTAHIRTCKLSWPHPAQGGNPGPSYCEALVAALAKNGKGNHIICNNMQRGNLYEQGFFWNRFGELRKIVGMF